MRSSPDGTVSTFATFSVVGDALVPQEITDALEFFPSTTYAKGDTYYGGPKSGNVRGKTGVWFFSTDKILTSQKLDDHTLLLMNMLAPEVTLSLFESMFGFRFSIGRVPSALVRLHKVTKLVNIMKARHLKASIGLFWHGAPGAKPPLPRRLIEAFEAMSISVTMDFATDEKPTGHAPSRVA